MLERQREVLADRRRQNVGVLEHHSRCATQEGDVHPVPVRLHRLITQGQRDLTFRTHAREQVVHPIHRTQQCRLARTRRADERRDLSSAELDIDVGEHARVAEPHAETGNRDQLFHLRSRLLCNKYAPMNSVAVSVSNTSAAPKP